VCGEGSEVATWFVSRLLCAAGCCVGTASQNDVYVNQLRLESVAGAPRPQRQREIFLHPLLSAAVFESSTATLLEGGLAFDQCDVAIIGAPAEMPLERGPVEPVIAAAEKQLEPGMLARVVAGTVGSDGFVVLWADDPLAEQTAAASRGGTIWLSRDGSHPRLVEARARGGRVAFIGENALWFATGEQQWRLAAGAWGRALESGAADVGWQPLLAAMAAGWALGLAEHQLAAALAAFSAAAAKPADKHPNP